MTLVRGGRALPDFAACHRIFAIIALLAFSPLVHAQYDPSLYAGMQWRQVGPFRAGRVTGVSGVPGQPAIYYMGTAGGGAWKTTVQRGASSAVLASACLLLQCSPSDFAFRVSIRRNFLK